MRFIRAEDIQQIQLPADWEANVRAAEEAVAFLANADREDRGREIDRFAATTWSAVKTELAKLNFDKCWYCDCRQDRSDNAVDHFRPKKKVTDDPLHPGYWWLAFRLGNFRYSCTFCNSTRIDKTTGESRGKQNNFPVVPPFRQMVPGEEWQNEVPLLLDPTNDQDIGLLTWKVDGKPDARFVQLQHERWWQKATISIRVYHLDHAKLNALRRTIYSDINMKIRDGDLYFSRALGGDATAEHALGRIKQSLALITRDEAPCREAARHYLGEFRTVAPGRFWLTSIP